MTEISWDERNSIVFSWPIMSSPFPLISIFAIYIWFVVKAGPNFMANRKPYDLSMVTRIYNIYQIIACTFFVVIGHKLGFTYQNTWKCIDEPKHDGIVKENLMAANYYLWFFVLLRLSELLETVFFILRKKFEQVSILHIYHHISSVVLVWVFLLYSGGMMEWFLGALNSAVHVIMYGYYLLSSYKKLRKFTNFIKPFITFLQIVQLFLIFGHCVVAVLPGCKASRLFILQLFNVGFLILMFMKFYFDSYIRKKIQQKFE